MSMDSDPQASSSPPSTAKMRGVMKAATAFHRAGQRSSMRVQKRQALLVDDQSRSVQGIDQLRNNARSYEYLCHLEEAKRWLEAVLSERLPPPEKLGDRLANGVLLLKLANSFSPKKLRVFDPDESVFESQGMSFRHSDNVLKFISAMNAVQFPTIYHPEVPDVYEKKNIPRLIYCLHALSVFLYKMNMTPMMEDLVGVVDFTDEQLNEVDRTIDESVGPMPSFARIKGQSSPKLQEVVAKPEPVPEPAVTKPAVLPEQGYCVFWPFKLDDVVDHRSRAAPPSADWLSKSASSKSIDVQFEELALRAQEAAQEDRFNAADLLRTLEELPVIKSKMEEAIAEETIDEPVFEAEDDESYQEAKASYVLFEDQVCWDNMYWGVAQPYPVSWPFFVDDYESEQASDRAWYLDQCREMIDHCLVEQYLAILEYVNAEYYHMPSYDGTTFDELIQSAFPTLYTAMQTPSTESTPPTEPSPTVLVVDDYPNADTYYCDFYHHLAYAWDDCFAYLPPSPAPLIFAHRLEHALARKPRRLPSLGSRRSSATRAAERVAQVVRRQRQRSQSVGVRGQCADIRSRLRSGSPSRGVLSAPATRQTKSAVELGSSTPTHTRSARRSSGASADGTRSVRSPRQLPTPPRGGRQATRNSSRSSLGSVTSVSSKGSQSSLMGDVVEGHVGAAITRATVPTAVGNSNNGSLNGTPAIKASRDSSATITYEGSLPAVTIHQVEETPVGLEPSPDPILLASKSITPLSPRQDADVSISSTGTVGEEVDDDDQWL
eukprot:m.139703 g.139703  ORF g.139703 m.139703 type:complete len:775 (-) comp16096_c0_seq1:96-2420(-)